MQKLSVIILSYALDEEVYQMNRHTLESLLASELWPDDSLDIVLMESNKQNPYRYDDIFVGHEHQARFRIEVPQEKFNFHRFLNLGIAMTEGDFVAMCNNDIEFRPGWYTAIMNVKCNHPKFMCFSPLDRSYPLMMEDVLPSTQPYYIGWENKKHYAAWCMVWERKVFRTIGMLDERYDFYSADGDELLTLRKYAIPNVVVTGSEVKHLSQVVTKKMDERKSPIIPQEVRDQYPLTAEEIRRGWTWLWEDIRFYEAYQKDKQKWGHERTVGRINRFFERHPWLHVRPLSILLYNRKVNVIMTRLMGIKW